MIQRIPTKRRVRLNVGFCLLVLITSASGLGYLVKQWLS